MYIIVKLFIAFQKLPKEVSFDFKEFCSFYGYNCQIERFYTQDEYQIQLYLIQKDGVTHNGKQVFIQHGVSDCSYSFVLAKKNSLAFVLANMGYKVWLGNLRGNKHSSLHKKLCNSKRDFWNFTFNDHISDIEESFNYIYQKTQQKIQYIGHSMGCSLYIALLSQSQEIQDKLIQKSIFIMPSIYPYLNRNARFLSKLFTGFIDLRKFENILPIYQVNYFNKISATILSTTLTAFPFLGNLLFKHWYGIDSNLCKNLGLILNKTPGGASTKCALWFDQVVKSGKFEYYDFGKKINIEKYNQETHPQIDLTKVQQLKCLVFTGSTDPFSCYEEIQKLQKQISETNKIKHIQYKTGHVGLLWGSDTKYIEQIDQFIQS